MMIMKKIIFLNFIYYILFGQLLPAAEPVLQDLQAECAKKPNSTWSLTQNRCVTKMEVVKTREDSQNCSKFTTQNEQADCYKKIAEQKTGLSSDPNSLPSGTVGTGSMLMNGVGTAYAIVEMINGKGKGGMQSECTSKKIFGITAMAGIASDFWLKSQAKKKLNSLNDKYQIDIKNNAYNSQSQAFEYLKEEQLTVKEIASLEKKRNLLLTLGYGSAAAMAIYEMTGANPACYKKEGVQEGAKENTVGNKPAAPAAVPTPPKKLAYDFKFNWGNSIDIPIPDTTELNLIPGFPSILPGQ